MNGSGSGATLPRVVVVPLNTVNLFFPQVTQEASSGDDPTAQGNPTATLRVIYANSDGSQLVTITVDEYANSDDALSAYQIALQKSEIVAGFTLITVPNLARQTFAGTVTMGGETHVGLGVLDGTLVVGATLAGFIASSDNVGRLVAMASTEDATAKIALGIPLCFAAGTRVATPRGSSAVEHLRVGDTVLTVAGTSEAIRWIGRRHVDCRRHAKPDRVMPVRVAPHAFGEGRPSREVLLSPDHSVFVDDVLIPIKLLLNDSTISQLSVHAITYYHIALARHHVVLAEGLPVETYLETGGHSAFDDKRGDIQLHPDFVPDAIGVSAVWQTCGYAPLVDDEVLLNIVRTRLRLQAELLSDSASISRARRVA